MKIGLVDVDGRNFPNLALMKISAFHKKQGDIVEFADPMFGKYDQVYMSKVFTHSQDYQYFFDCKIEKGGTGYDLHKELPDEIDKLQPDYSLYPFIENRTAYGFLTRGCPNKCKWCIVPLKEGNIRPYMDVEEVAINGRTNLILMDNNILASDYGLSQIEKIVSLKYKVDFNQALDARLVTDDIAALLAKVRWSKRIRFGCDTQQQIVYCERAISLLNKHGYHGGIFLYCILTDDFQESFSRINFWKNRKNVIPYAQPYLELNNLHQIIPQWQKDLARWTNRKELYTTCNFREFEPRKGFKCSAYFENG